jgi:integrase
MHIDLLKSEKLATYSHGLNGAGKPIDKEHNDGGGLYLIVKPSGAKSWMFKFTWAGKPRKMGLGSLQLVTLQQARDLAYEARKSIAAGINPLITRPGAPTQKSSPTFLEIATEVMKVKSHGQAEKSIEAWDRCVTHHCRSLHKKEIATITRQHIIDLLEPIWLTTPIAAQGVRSKLFVIFRSAQSDEIYPQDKRNPADWELLKDKLKKQPEAGTIRGANKSVPYAQAPEFWTKLLARNTISSKTLQFCMLTCVRTNEAMQTDWNQIDLDREEGARWQIPGKVMKNGLPADVPLSSDAVELLRQMKALHEQNGWSTKKGLIFRGKDNKSVQSENTLLKLIKVDLGYDATTHGCRTTFRSWTQNKTEHDEATLEYCLHHIKGDAALLAYARGDMWEKRQAALQDWNDYLAGRKFQAPKRGRPPLSLVA